MKTYKDGKKPVVLMREDRDSHYDRFFRRVKECRVQGINTSDKISACFFESPWVSKGKQYRLEVLVLVKNEIRWNEEGFVILSNHAPGEDEIMSLIESRKNK